MIEVAGGVSLQMLTTPGHSIDSVCYYLQDEGVSLLETLSSALRRPLSRT